MNNTYHRDIIEILQECGRQGYRIKKIAQRIYNLHADFFATDVNYDEIHRSVGRYLWRQSKRLESPFCRTCYGTYAIKPGWAIQLDLFHDISPRAEEPEEEPEREPAPAPHHIQLELF